jgi:hypothetical protein
MRLERRLLPAALCLAASPLAAQDLPREPEPRGPIEMRDEHLLAQGRLTLPAASPFTVPAGRTELRLGLQWANSFAWTQDVAGESPADRRFLIDGETRTLDLVATRGFGSTVDLSLRVPLRWRGGGVLDGFIDGWHRAIAFLGVPDGSRPKFRTNAFRIEGQRTDGERFAWDGQEGAGLGNLEVAARLALAQDRAAGRAVSLIARGSLPTASTPFERTGGAGLQLVAAQPLGRKWTLYMGAGGTLEGERVVNGLRYARARGHAFAAVELRLWRFVSLSVETDAATRLVEDIDQYPGLHWMLNGGLTFDLAPRTQVEVGIVENLMDQSSTTDFGLVFGLRVRP